MRVTKSSIGGVLLAVAAITGCQSGSEGGVNIGSGQAADPVVLDFPVAYVRRAVPTGDEDVRELRTFQAGADLFLRDRASPAAIERNITGVVTNGEWDVRDVDVSFDGEKLVFAMRPPLIENADESEQPTWNVWEYDRTADTLRRVISSDLVAEEGHDVAPHYLPDGRIVFSSTRQRQSKAALIDEGKPQFAAVDEDRNEWGFVLHVMGADGSGIRQISFNQSHDLDPALLNDGRIMFARWDNAGPSGVHLYTVNPDGSGLELLYGANSHDTGPQDTTIQFLSPRTRPDGSVVALVRPFEDTEVGGDIVEIDAGTYVENTQATLANAGLAGPAQRKLTSNDVRTVEGPSPGGRFASVYPLWDGTDRLLVSWSICRVLDAAGTRTLPCTDDNLADPAVLPAPPLYGIYMYDPRDVTQRPVFQPEEGVMYTDVVAMQPRTPLPPVVLDAVAGVDYDAQLATENVGIVHIRSIYDFDGADTAPGGITVVRDPGITTADQRPARFVRIEKAVSLPDDEVRDFVNTAFGRSNVMREILGYAPVEPDGSVMVKVPAGVAFGITMLDRDGRRISTRHQNWLQVRAGEVLSCNGCHVPAGAQPQGQPPLSHGRSGLFASANPGAPTTGVPFPNTDPALFADQGETMAETRMRISCQTDCAALSPSVDLLFDDVWTDPAVRAPDASISYRYMDLQSPAPTSSSCQTTWSSVCRITIHYPDHIQPLWDLTRQILDVDGVTVLEDRSCLSCHSPRDAADALRVPAGQLDLTGEPSPDETDHFVSFRELMFTDAAQEVNMGALQDILVPGPPDPVTGDPTFVTVPVPPSMSPAGARASARFFSRFDAGGSHFGYLSGAELRLIAEWLDIGGQYYNDPFAAPED